MFAPQGSKSSYRICYWKQNAVHSYCPLCNGYETFFSHEIHPLMAGKHGKSFYLIQRLDIIKIPLFFNQLIHSHVFWFVSMSRWVSSLSSGSFSPKKLHCLTLKMKAKQSPRNVGNQSLKVTTSCNRFPVLHIISKSSLSAAVCNYVHNRFILYIRLHQTTENKQIKRNANFEFSAALIDATQCDRNVSTFQKNLLPPATAYVFLSTQRNIPRNFKLHRIFAPHIYYNQTSWPILRVRDILSSY